jgi:hypothetical protein
VDSNKDISRRAFVSLMGAGAVGQILPQQQEGPAGPSAAVKEAVQGIKEPPGTTQILSLVHENNKAAAFPWTLSTLLRTKHTSGEAAANFVRLSNYGGGWGPASTPRRTAGAARRRSAPTSRCTARAARAG